MIKRVADLTAASAILQYWNEIQSGGINAGKWIKLLYDVILQGLTEHKWYYSHERAENAIGFIESYADVSTSYCDFLHYRSCISG